MSLDCELIRFAVYLNLPSLESLQCHAIVSTQYTDGVTGALIVHPTQNTSTLPTYDSEIVIQVRNPTSKASATPPEQCLDVRSLPRSESGPPGGLSLSERIHPHPVYITATFA